MSSSKAAGQPEAGANAAAGQSGGAGSSPSADHLGAAVGGEGSFRRR
ncbi:hypothetical protein K2224_20430 [Streptomyces sp. BHT-5-2]|nr:hypothetical protein [Streptomyces sp. BHT-5-2]QZL05216.1 hypothetical protein K2224_20430 [Streptomyces sp. BHT-5-2]